MKLIFQEFDYATRQTASLGFAFPRKKSSQMKTTDMGRERGNFRRGEKINSEALTVILCCWLRISVQVNYSPNTYSKVLFIQCCELYSIATHMTQTVAVSAATN